MKKNVKKVEGVGGEGFGAVLMFEGSLHHWVLAIISAP